MRIRRLQPHKRRQLTLLTQTKYLTLIHERVAQANEGKNPWAIARLDSVWVVASEVQPLYGYCIVLSNPVVSSLNEMSEEHRLLYCRDMLRVGDAIIKVTGAAHINYETWANKDPALHTHIVPRFANEAPELRIKPALIAYDFSKAPKFDALKDAAFVQKMREALAPFVRA